MEIINIDARAWTKVVGRIDTLTKVVTNLLKMANDKGEQKWMNNREVCALLNISLRTLQTYRDNGKLPYTQINHKIYYKPSDVEKILI